MDHLKVTEWKEPNLCREDLVEKIVPNGMGRGKLRMQLYFYVCNPTNFNEIEKRFYCKELIELVQARAMKHIEEVIIPRLKTEVNCKRRTNESAEQYLKWYHGMYHKMMDIIRDEITKPQEKQL